MRGGTLLAIILPVGYNNIFLCTTKEVPVSDKQISDTALAAIAKSVRSLSMDAVEAAQSGHPGLPMGLAELGALIYGEALQHYPLQPDWVNRDRFVLSAGHGSLLQYSLMYLAGFSITLDDIKAFRQLHSRTPGHPEYQIMPGIEATTGPLGQGLSNAIGMAIAESHVHALFKDESGSLVDHFIYSIASDGDMMEGVTSEACSLAGHLRLGKLIVFYDDNHISIEGDTELAFTENVEQRFAAYGWQTLSASAYNADQIRQRVSAAKAETNRPTLIRIESIIGKGAPNKENSAKVHGSPLGSAEITATRAALQIESPFFVDSRAQQFFKALLVEQEKSYNNWQIRFKKWSKDNPNDYAHWQRFFDHRATDYRTLRVPTYTAGDSIATRSASGAALVEIAKQIPNLIGGSADLAPSNMTFLPEYGDYSATNRVGRTIHFGVREHAMGAITNGLLLYGAFRPFCATFMVFSDYMRGSIRLAAIMQLPIIYLFSHDSIYVGEDGPTHQPVEHLAALRAIPNVDLLRPADAEETALAWKLALQSQKRPTILALSRQKLPVIKKDDSDWEQNSAYGAYIYRKERGALRVIIIATGSEVSLAITAAERLKDGVRVISMMSRNRFEHAPASYKAQLLPPSIPTIVVEAGVGSGWEQYVQQTEDLIVISGFGASGPKDSVAELCGLTAERIVERLAVYHTS